MNRVDLGELDKSGARCELTVDQAAALDATGLVKPRPEGGGWWRLWPNGYAGAVRIDDLDVEVHPKVGIARLLFLLGYAGDPGFRPEDVGAEAETELWPALAESLARQAERALAAGVMQGYVSVDDALPLVRGRIRFADQISHRAGLPLPVEVRYDEYSPDIAENRILRTALRRMRAVPRLPESARARLGHLDARLDGVRVLPHGAIPPEWRPSRLNARYLPALRLAALVLRQHSAEPGPGGQRMAAFVVDMARVFEDFLTTALREALAGRPGHTAGQYHTHLDTSRKILIKPDVVHLAGGRPVAVFDAKYKLSYPNEDAYQMLAYCTALGLARGWLVYAQGAASGPLPVRNTGIEIIRRPLDLTAPPGELLAQVRILADQAVPAQETTTGVRRPRALPP
ncbi:McrBC 5-methylcytosine restriction system component [Actinoplanes lobatus]|uniref:McrBC 5-methylcytosine restriction system component n=1 Tax=Actinoplanes lobatus TaxID=113568 RepID=A0ABQ4AAC5_9ACTN|nr:restriction endonuclease [Actinoplanes lobatus]GGN60022.1 McrBC 5-methylcytosine restriction system component [Actinoplanes lobatus]GIE37939.1 McrBC 5-methylcytosine restriction system component [Actinoplanes lobatus]